MHIEKTSQICACPRRKPGNTMHPAAVASAAALTVVFCEAAAVSFIEFPLLFCIVSSGLCIASSGMHVCTELYAQLLSMYVCRWLCRRLCRRLCSVHCLFFVWLISLLWEFLIVSLSCGFSSHVGVLGGVTPRAVESLSAHKPVYPT